MMRARTLRQPEEAAMWLARLADTRWVDLDGYTEVLFSASVRRRFDDRSDVRDIAIFVWGMATAYENDRLKVPQIEAEMLIRQALGETVPIGDLDWKESNVLQQITFSAVVDDLGYDLADMDQFLHEIDSLAFERGFLPTTVGDYEATRNT
jgi:hypothetical protein